MLDIVLECARVIVLVIIVMILLRADHVVAKGRDGWLWFKLGFLCVLFGSVVDVTDNFESLNWAIVLGDTPVQAFLEKGVGYLGGFTLIAYGIWRWLLSLEVDYQNNSIES